MSRQWANAWYSSDECLELGDRTRWALMFENEGDPRERYWHMVLETLAGAEPRSNLRPIETLHLPEQLTLVLA